MFEKVLVISEPMPNAEMILKCLVNLQKIGTKECLLFQCLDPRILYETPATLFTDIFHGNLESQTQFLVQQGLAVTSRESDGYIKDEINQVAHDEHCSLIIAGAPAQSLLGDYLFGNLAYAIMHGAKMPLLIIRIPGRTELPEAIRPSRDLTTHILFPTDFSDNANQAFNTLKQMVAAGVRKITLLHIQDKARLEPYLLGRLDEFNSIDAARLRTMADELKRIGPVDAATLLLYGSPTTEILNIIKDQQISLVIMGSQGRGFIKEISLGSVSQNIARHSIASVLLIPAAR